MFYIKDLILTIMSSYVFITLGGGCSIFPLIPTLIHFILMDYTSMQGSGTKSNVTFGPSSQEYSSFA